MDRTLGDTLYKWFNSYLDGRSQYVMVGDRIATSVLCGFGVPQGSVLGARRCSFYTPPTANVIAQFSHVNHAQYADQFQYTHNA